MSFVITYYFVKALKTYFKAALGCVLTQTYCIMLASSLSLDREMISVPVPS